MAGFNAEKVVDPLAYTFGKYADVKDGITPEPDDEQIAKFQRNTADLARRHRADQDGIDVEDRIAVMEWMANQPPEKAVEMEQETAMIYADLCSGKPSFEEIMKVPPRVRQAWMGWLAGELHPESARPASTG